MKPPSFASPVRPIYLISLYSGFLFFTIDMRTFTAQVRPANILTMILVAVVNALMSLPYWFVAYFSSFLEIEMTERSMPLLIAFDHSSCLFALFWLLHCRHELVAFLRLCTEIDDLLAELGAKFDFVAQRRRVVGVTVAMVCVVVGTMSYSWFTQMDAFDIHLLAFSVWLFLVWVLFFLHFLFAALAVGHRLELACTVLESKRAFEAKKLAKVHLKIAEAVRLSNRIYSVPMTVFYASLFAWTCVTIFTFIVLPKGDLSDIKSLIGMGVSIAISLFELVTSVRAAERISLAKKRAIELCYRLLMTRTDNTEVVNFISQLWHTDIAIGCRFFDFDSKFLFNFVTTTVMYFVILLQFEKCFGK